MAGSFLCILRDTARRPFGYVRLCGALLALVLAPLLTAHLNMREPVLLYEEGGVVENLSVAFWIGAVLLCLGVLLRRRPGRQRLVFGWLLLLCSLAASRELDAHVWLNPDHFGPYGVHYRIDWFISNKFGASIFLKLAWGGIFFVGVAGILSPPVILRRPLVQAIRRGDTASGLFLAGVVALAIGFVNDDILRDASFMSRLLRESIEETSELFGAVCFFAGVCCLAWRPPLEEGGCAAVDAPDGPPPA